MLKRWLAALGLSLLAGAAVAQTPSPGQLGLVIATPNVVQVLDSSKHWSSIGTIDATTHLFTPTNAFPEAPNDATLYGRKSLAWSHITHNDITDWAASVPPPTPPGGSSGQVQFNSGGSAFGGFTASGDATINTATGAVSVTKTGGTAFGALATLTPGAGVATALGAATNANGGVALANTGLTNGNLTKWSATGLVDGGAAGASIVFPQTVSGTANSGGIPYFSSATVMSSSAALSANSIVIGKGAGVAPTTTGTGSNVLSALAINVNTAGAIVTNGGQLGTPSSGTLTNATGLPISTGVAGLGTGVATAAGLAMNSNGGLAAAVIPTAVGGSGSLSGADGYYICTGVCTVTLPTPAAGFQFCIRNDSAVTTVITIAAISGVQFEKTTYNGYGTVTTGTMVSGGALGDKICLIGRDATHYLVGAFVGTWTNS